MKFYLNLFLILFAINFIEGGRRGGGGGNGRNTDLEVQQAIERTNKENLEKITKLTTDFSKAVQEASAEAGKAREQLMTWQSEREKEKADKIAEQEALDNALKLLYDELVRRETERNNKDLLEEEQRKAYEKLLTESELNEENEFRLQIEAWNKLNEINEKKSLEEAEKKARIEGEIWKRIRDKIKF